LTQPNQLKPTLNQQSNNTTLLYIPHHEIKKMKVNFCYVTSDTGPVSV